MAECASHGRSTRSRQDGSRPAPPLSWGGARTAHAPRARSRRDRARAPAERHAGRVAERAHHPHVRALGILRAGSALRLLPVAASGARFVGALASRPAGPGSGPRGRSPAPPLRPTGLDRDGDRDRPGRGPRAPLAAPGARRRPRTRGERVRRGRLSEIGGSEPPLPPMAPHRVRTRGLRGPSPRSKVVTATRVHIPSHSLSDGRAPGRVFDLRDPRPGRIRSVPHGTGSAARAARASASIRSTFTSGTRSHASAVMPAEMKISGV